MDWLEEKKNGALVLHLLIQPKASRSQLVGPHGDPPRFKIRIAAPPVDGEANEELLRFLAKTLDCAKSHLSLLRGSTGKQKDISVDGLSKAAVLAKMYVPLGCK